MNIKPLNDRIVVKKNTIPTRSVGGIIIPDTAENKPQDGVVLAVGEGVWDSGKRIPLSVEVNDTVIFGKNAGVEIEHENEKYFIMHESEIVAIIK